MSIRAQFRQCQQCNLPACDCECLNGFVDRTNGSDSSLVSRLSQGCKQCSNALPSGSWLERKVGDWDSGEKVVAGRRFVPWKSDLCRPCLIESNRNTKSANYSKMLGAKLRVMGNPWHDIDRIMQQCAYGVVRALGGFWSYMVISYDSPLNLPSEWLYRVGQALPSEQHGQFHYFMLASGQADTTGQWTQGNSRPLDKG